MPKVADLLGIVGSTFTIGTRSLAAGLRRIAVRSGSFLGAIDWTITGNRTIVLPDDSVTLLGDDRPIGTLNAGVSLRGYEPIVTVTATKTLAMSDSGTVQNCTNAAAAIVTIPLNSAVGFPIGTRIIIRKTTAQTVTIAFSAGITVLNSLGTTLTITGVTSSTVLRKTGVDAWIAFPDLPETAIGAALRTSVDSTSAKSTIGLSLVTNVLLAEPRALVIQIGTNAGIANVSGALWVAIGSNAGSVNTTGNAWTAIGANAGGVNTTLGWTAVWTAIGAYAGGANTVGGFWTAIGAFAGGSNTTGNNWIAIGADSGRNSTTGNNWTTIGVNTGLDVTTGSSNTMIGANTGRGITTGGGNTIIGASVTGLPASLENNVILASGDGVIKLQVDSTGLATLPISPVFSDNSTLVATTAHVKNVLSNSPSITLAVLRWANGAFLGSLGWTPTAARTIVLPDESGTIALAIPPIKLTTIGANTATIPASAIGFDYVLCAAGGGGGNGGPTIGGGGAACGEFITGTILISEMMSTLTLTRAQVILTVTIGASTAIGERGGSSTLAIGSSTIAIVQGGYGGLTGTASQGWGPWSGGTTYTTAGGLGQMEQRHEARLVGEPNSATIVRLNLFGDGGNGGASNAAGLLGLPGYFSIQFF